ncbi:MAG: ribonucleoside-triphosphate reductase, adenosylcobalamin-dependent [Candidatus Bipolaricaulia bacterium]
MANINSDFPKEATCADVTYYRTYSRVNNGVRETFLNDTVPRCLNGIYRTGHLTKEEKSLLKSYLENEIVFPSGRWMWVGGTKWLEEPENWPGAYNCTGTNIDAVETFGKLMDLAMQGCGTGANLEKKYIDQLPTIQTKLKVNVVGEFGSIPKSKRLEETKCELFEETKQDCRIIVGDSRKGWVKAYQLLINFATSETPEKETEISVDLSHIRPKGERLKGFGGVSNPFKLKELFPRVAEILNGSLDRQMNAEECCLLIDEAASAVVAGNVRRSAGIRQFDEDEPLLKLGLWQQDGQGNFSIDPKRSALRMANHTRVFHRKPTFEELREAIALQVQCGEGAVQYAPEAVARANADLLDTEDKKKEFLHQYNHPSQSGSQYLEHLLREQGIEITADVDREINHRMERYSLNPCSEIIGSNFFCNLGELHANRLDPDDEEQQKEAAYANGLWTAPLLERGFVDSRYQGSREKDPIVGPSITGLFDFFVHKFGVDWLRWWLVDRKDGWTPRSIDWETMSRSGKEAVKDFVQKSRHESDAFRQEEKRILKEWRDSAVEAVTKYCQRNGLKTPYRITCVKPSGTQSLLTNASPGWHPPKAIRYIRRITVGKDDQVGLAALDAGYLVVPSQSDIDEHGNLLKDPFDSRCSEWLIEIPTKVSWADLPGIEEEGIDPYDFSVKAQYDFFMTVQQNWTDHNTSATLELHESEIDDLATLIFNTVQHDGGYISGAILQKFDPRTSSFPRLPFEPIDEDEYCRRVQEVASRCQVDSFKEALDKNSDAFAETTGPSGCDSTGCTLA